MKTFTPPVLACIAFLASAATPRADFFATRMQGALNGTVMRAERRDRALGVIELFSAALTLLEMNRHLDKLDTLFARAAEFQDRVPDSRSYGNYRWYFRDGYVMDWNAVDFCMQYGSVIAHDHLDKLTSAQRTAFDTLLDLSITGCLNHSVRSSYTNIALMNAVNLILLGESCGRTDAFNAGLKRLDDFILTTALFGVCEYSSPTYTAVDILNLHRLHALVKDPAVHTRAERLLALFWTDVCASSFAGAGRLGGTHSRDYDYLYGRGAVASLLSFIGLGSVPGKGTPSFELALDDWRPSSDITRLAARAPRFLESRWGEEEEEVRTYWAGHHVALGVSGANYWNMDIPLAVDFVSPQPMVRGYFIADARRDPYGQKKIPEGSGPHQKTLHLKPFWGGVQRTRDAVGLVVYRAGDVPSETPTLESHFVFPSNADEIRINDESVRLAPNAPFARPLQPGDAVFVRVGGGALGIRVPWSRALNGTTAPCALVWDASTSAPACRLTVAHHDFWGHPLNPRLLPGAAFWLRVCDSAGDPSAFAAFRTVFRAAHASTQTDATRIALDLVGEEGPLVLAAKAPFAGLDRYEPAPRSAVLALDGHDIGAEILGDVPGVAEYRAELARVKEEMSHNRLVLSSRHNALWEAEIGALVPKMTIGEDPDAFGGKFVWTPGKPGLHGSDGAATVSWQLDVREAGTYHLWGRVSTPTPDDDSFFVSANAGEFSPIGKKGPLLLARTYWHASTTLGPWKWVRFPTEIPLPAGPAVLNVHCREDGAKLDRLFLSADASAEPSE